MLNFGNGDVCDEAAGTHPQHARRARARRARATTARRPRDARACATRERAERALNPFPALVSERVRPGAPGPSRRPARAATDRSRPLPRLCGHGRVRVRCAEFTGYRLKNYVLKSIGKNLGLQIVSCQNAPHESQIPNSALRFAHSGTSTCVSTHTADARAFVALVVP